MGYKKITVDPILGARAPVAPPGSATGMLWIFLGYHELKSLVPKSKQNFDFKKCICVSYLDLNCTLLLALYSVQ